MTRGAEFTTVVELLFWYAVTLGLGGVLKGFRPISVQMGDFWGGVPQYDVMLEIVMEIVMLPTCCCESVDNLRFCSVTQREMRLSSL